MQTDQSNYDFILAGQQKSTRKIPQLSGPALIIVAVFILMILIAIGGTLLGSKKNKVGSLVEIIGQAQEINRVSANQVAQLQEANDVAVATTTMSTLTSDQAQLKQYASAHKIKIDPKKLAAYKNSLTDSTLAQAASNNTLDVSYRSYLRGALTDYQQALNTTFASTSDQGVKDILRNSYQSIKVLLNSQPLKS